MLSTSLNETFSSDDENEVSEDTEENAEDDDNRIELMEYEKNLMLDTLSDDVLIIVARGLGLERLMLHHLHLYSDSKLLVLVINTTQNDEAYFLSRLRSLNPNCPPKIINADVSVKDRENLYLEGGIQFVTSRVLMVDLLQDRLPVRNVAGIIVNRAHQLISGYQESFILRLYRERKPDGFVKAFSDNPNSLCSMGHLQRLVNRLYVRRVRLLPRFDVDVKRVLDICAPKLIEMTTDLPHSMRRIQSYLVDILRICLKELKQSSSSVEVDVDEESSHPSSGLSPSQLEIQLKSQSLVLTEKQQRLLGEISVLRSLLRKAEELDPVSLYADLMTLKSDPEQKINNSGWLFTATAAKLLSDIESTCCPAGREKSKVVEPPKWNVLKKVLSEIRSSLLASQQFSQDEAAVLVMGSNVEACHQLSDLIKWGATKLLWVQESQLIVGSSLGKRVAEPQIEPLWDPEQVFLFASHFECETKSDIINGIKALQKTAMRKGRQRRKLAENKKKKMEKNSGQTRLVQFGIVHYKRSIQAAGDQVKTESKDEEESATAVEATPSPDLTPSSSGDPLLVIIPHGERYNLIRKLESLSPSFIVLFHSDLVTLRLLEVYKATHPDHEMVIYVIMYKESNEEERYLNSLRKEQIAFEQLIREQSTLVVSRKYDTAREPPPSLKLTKPVRGVVNGSETQQSETPSVIIDVRELNSELPTVIYKRGTDLIPATLEVGDYILTPDVVVERKALDDLTQSLYSGRVFKQIEQMLRNYRRVILLVEANTRNDYRSINGGPFQGELSRRCRMTRQLFAMLVRTYPSLNVVWSLHPLYSAELFEEFKFNEANPNLENALAIKSDGMENLETPSDAKETEEGKKKETINPVLQRQLGRLYGLGIGDVKRLMSSKSLTSLLDVITADRALLSESIGSEQLTNSLVSFLNTDYRMDAFDS